jgi:cytochrome c peroxidase
MNRSPPSSAGSFPATRRGTGFTAATRRRSLKPTGAATSSSFSTAARPASAATAARALTDDAFHNTALYADYPAPNRGVCEHTRRPADLGRFKTPTLRNIALTAPYMHDGSIATLEEVLDHYAAGGRASGNPRKTRCCAASP